MAGMTNRGKKLRDDVFFRGSAHPCTTSFKLALVTSAVAPTVDSNVFSAFTEIAAGNGYTSGGMTIEKSAVGFDSLVEDDGSDRCCIQLKDAAWTASGGNLPASGNGARYALLLDDNATVGSRQVLTYWDLGSDRVVSSGQVLTLQNCELRDTE